MNIHNIFKAVVIVSMVGLFGCGGGGGGGTPPSTPPTVVTKTTTTISGSVSFPSISSLVAKRVNALVPDAFVTVQAYKLNGDPIGSPVTPLYDDTIIGSSTDFTKRVYTYSLPDIPLGVDYVIKAKRVENGNTQELKKLIEKSEVVDNMPSQSVDSVSTAAVVVASQKLTAVMGITNASGGAVKVSLGDTLPVEMQNSVSKLSDAIITDVSPKVLEASILSAKTNSDAAAGGFITYVSTLSPTEKQAFVDLVNMLNIVVTAVANNADPAKILSGDSVSLSTAKDVPQLKLLTVDTTSGSVAQDLTARTTITPQLFQDTVTSAVVTYVPPRVKLEFSTNSTQLYGLVFDVTVPVDAKVRADATGKLDMALLTVPSGVSVDAQYNAATRKIRIAVASSTLGTPLPAKIAELSFDRTQGIQLKDTNFTFVKVSTSDLDGNSITTLLNVSLNVTSSGP
jgi:hypothetical protein